MSQTLTLVRKKSITLTPFLILMFALGLLFFWFSAFTTVFIEIPIKDGEDNVSIKNNLKIKLIFGKKLISATLTENNKLSYNFPSLPAQSAILKTELKPNTDYTLKVTGESLLGVKKNLVIKFETAGPVILEKIKAENDPLINGGRIKNIDSLDFYFNKAVDEIYIILNGKEYFIKNKNGSSKVKFKLPNDLNHENENILIIKKKTRAYDGSIMDKEYSFRFLALAPPQIVYSYPQPDQKILKKGSVIKITFDKAMNEKSVVGLFKMTANKNKITGNFTWSQDFKEFNFTPLQEIPAGAEINIFLPAGVKAQDESFLEEDFRLELKYESGVSTLSSRNDSDFRHHGKYSGKHVFVEYSVNYTAKVFAYENDKLVKTMVGHAPGPGYRRIRGEFRIKSHANPLKSTKYGPYDLPYWMQLEGNYGFHSYKVNRENGKVEPGPTHGCVALKSDDAAWFYEWAENGTPVSIK